MKYSSRVKKIEKYTAKQKRILIIELWNKIYQMKIDYKCADDMPPEALERFRIIFKWLWKNGGVTWG